MTHDPELVPYQQAIRRHVLEQLERNLAQAVAHGDTWPDLECRGDALAIFSLLDTLSLRADESIGEQRLIADAHKHGLTAPLPAAASGLSGPRVRRWEVRP